MITTDSTVTIQKVLKYGTPTSYDTSVVSVFLTHEGVQKRFNATSVLNATSTSSGLVTFAGIPLWGDGSYSLYVTAETNSDLDSTGVNLAKLATGYIKKITSVSTLTL